MPSSSAKAGDPVRRGFSVLSSASPPSLPGLTRQSILFERLLRRLMDARVKPGHDELLLLTRLRLLATHCARALPETSLPSK